jgi:hypothetical protein
MIKPKDPNIFNFQAKIPTVLWHQWEEWTAGRPPFSNPQILEGLIRLFLHMPREVQKLIFNGTEEELAAELGKHGLKVPTVADATGGDQSNNLVRGAVLRVGGERYEQLSDADQKELNELRQWRMAADKSEPQKERKRRSG